MHPVPLDQALPRYRLGMCLLFFLFTLPVLVPYYETKGVSAAGFFMIEASFRLAYFVFSFFTGIVSDRWSRKGCLLLGTTLWGLGGLSIILGHGFWAVMMGEIMLAFGMAFFVSSGRAYLYDLLLSLEQASEHPKHLSRQRAWEHGARMLATAAGGFLFILWSEAPQVSAVITTAIAFIVFYRLPEPPRHKSQEKVTHLRDIVNAFKDVVHNHPGLIQLMLYGSSLVCLTTIVFWGIQPVMREIGVPTSYMGLALAAAGGLTAFFSSHAHAIIHRFGVKPILIALLPLAALEIFILAFVQHPLALLVFIINAFVFAMLTVGGEDLIQRQISSEVRATTLSLGLMLDMFFSSMALYAIGFLLKETTLSLGLFGVGAFFIVAGAGLLWSLLRVFGRLKQHY